MKKEIHPEYKEVVFRDEDADFAFLTRSTIKTSETITWEDGKEYPLVKLEISSASHPFLQENKNLLTLQVELKDSNNDTVQQVQDKHLSKKFLLKKKNNFFNPFFSCLKMIFLMVDKL